MASLDGESPKIIDKLNRESSTFGSLIWRTIKSNTWRVAKDQQSHGRSFLRDVIQGVCRIFSSFVAHCLHARYEKMVSCWTTSTRSRHVRIHMFA